MVLGTRKFHTARYYNANGFAVAVVAVITEGIDWSVYIGGTDLVEREADAVKWVAEMGAKLSRADAKYYFPDIMLPYRD